jgi:putative endonuclease
MYGGWVYIVTNKPNGMLYVGVTSDFARRIWNIAVELQGFTKRYCLQPLVWYENFADIRDAIQLHEPMTFAKCLWARHAPVLGSSPRMIRASRHDV